MATPPDLVAGSATGSIFDLGYRGYDGPRLGRRHAITALFSAVAEVDLRDRPRRPRQDRAVRAGRR